MSMEMPYGGGLRIFFVRCVECGASGVNFAIPVIKTVLCYVCVLDESTPRKAIASPVACAKTGIWC